MSFNAVRENKILAKILNLQYEQAKSNGEVIALIETTQITPSQSNVFIINHTNGKTNTFN